MNLEMPPAQLSPAKSLRSHEDWSFSWGWNPRFLSLLGKNSPEKKLIKLVKNLKDNYYGSLATML